MPTNEGQDSVPLAKYILLAGGHMDNYGPDPDGTGEPGNVTGERDVEETVVRDGVPTVVTTKHNGHLRRYSTTNERHPAIFRSPQLDLHKKYPHKYQCVEGGEPIENVPNRTNKPVLNKPKNDMLDNMTKNQLLGLAAEQEIDVEGITNKNELIRAIREAGSDS